MKAKCLTNRSGYAHFLTVGKMYEILDIQESMFKGDYYVVCKGDDGFGVTCPLYRFDITKEQAEAYVIKHHADWGD